jgi:hypothetical protein
MRKEGDPPGAKPNQTSRAALLVPGPALRHLWRPSVAGRQRLKCVRTDERALLRAEPGRRETLVRPLRRAGPAPRQPSAACATPATDLGAANLLDGRARFA